MSEKYSTIAVLSNQKLTQEQTLEIIRRTDQFFCEFYNGNNHEFNRKLYRLADVPADWDKLKKDHSCNDMSISDILGKDFTEKWNRTVEWRKKWGCLELSFLHNDWLSCSDISGPHGWISPNGEVGGYFSIGKYPSREDVEHDLNEIVKAFPFLEFTIYMIDEIYDDKMDVEAEWEVANGAVRLIKEDYTAENVEYSGIQGTDEYNKHLSEAPDFENWWTLDELKELWKNHLAQDIS